MRRPTQRPTHADTCMHTHTRTQAQLQESLSSGSSNSGGLGPLLFALPFVPRPHENPGLRFIFEEAWVQKLRSDLQAFLLAHVGVRHAPGLRHLVVPVCFLNATFVFCCLVATVAAKGSHRRQAHLQVSASIRRLCGVPALAQLLVIMLTLKLQVVA